jgi:hypothetical protein
VAVFLFIVVSIIVLIDRNTKGTRQGNIKHLPRQEPLPLSGSWIHPRQRTILQASHWDSILFKSAWGQGQFSSLGLWCLLLPFLHHQFVNTSFLDWIFHIHLPWRQVNSLRLSGFGYCIAYLCMLPGQYVKGSCSFISYDFSDCLKPNSVVEHINQGAIAPGSIFCPSDRTIILNDSLRRPFIIFPIANL